ncbi:MAG: twin-arginine translocation signal domain-containing protein [Bryobacteraceae bacterium]|nr:twin-arginine translocation signal domain-containing protein [Bryobacteraceae bacterium]
MNPSRRNFLAGAGAAGVATASKGYGAPLRNVLALKVTNPDAPALDPKVRGCEFPPNIVTVAGRRHVFMSGGMSYAYTVERDFHLLKEPNRMFETERLYAIGGFDYEMIRGVRAFNCDYDPQKFYWKKTYCGTFNVDVLPYDGREQWVFSINHCENKNERFVRPFGTFYVHNSINRNDPSGPDTSSGPTPTGYRDYQPGYFGFVSMSYAPVTAETKWGVDLQQHDMGAILWPRTPFLTTDGKTKNPLYKNPHPHPSSLVAEDPRDGKKYIYVWAIETPAREDASNMIIAARSPVEARGMPGSFLNFYRGDYTEPSLPKNMNQDIAVLATLPGGPSEAIHPTCEGRMNRFFVAQLKRSGLFLSIESYSVTEGQERYLESALRLSQDLRTWTERFVLPNSRVSSRQIHSPTPPFGLYYPKFLSADGSSHYLIDESEPFYIIATKPHALVYRELSIKIA